MSSCAKVLHGNTVKKSCHFYQIVLSKVKDSGPKNAKNLTLCLLIQARIAQLVAYQLGTGEVLGSNTGKSKNFSMKINN